MFAFVCWFLHLCVLASWLMVFVLFGFSLFACLPALALFLHCLALRVLACFFVFYVLFVLFRLYSMYIYIYIYVYMYIVCMLFCAYLFLFVPSCASCFCLLLFVLIICVFPMCLFAESGVCWQSREQWPWILEASWYCKVLYTNVYNAVWTSNGKKQGSRPVSSFQVFDCFKHALPTWGQIQLFSIAYLNADLMPQLIFGESVTQPGVSEYPLVTTYRVTRKHNLLPGVQQLLLMRQLQPPLKAGSLLRGCS